MMVGMGIVGIGIATEVGGGGERTTDGSRDRKVNGEGDGEGQRLWGVLFQSTKVRGSFGAEKLSSLGTEKRTKAERNIR